MDRLIKYNFKDDHGHSLENCVEFRAIFSDHAAEVARMTKERDASVAAKERAEEALESLRKEVIYILDHTPGAVRVHEGGLAPENIAASLAITWGKLQDRERTA
jgi:hypothetical protein